VGGASEERPHTMSYGVVLICRSVDLPFRQTLPCKKKPSSKITERLDMIGGEYRSRTDDLFTASQTLSNWGFCW